MGHDDGKRLRKNEQLTLIVRVVLLQIDSFRTNKGGSVYSRNVCQTFAVSQLSRHEQGQRQNAVANCN